MHAVDKRLFRAHSHPLFFLLLLASVTIFSLRPAWNGGFVWDDDDYIIKNDLLTASDEKGETAAAMHHYEKAVQISPKSISALTNLAWLLATSSNDALRDGNKAVKLAGEANQLLGGTNPVVLRTLAAGYAETGQFAKAIESAEASIQLARLSGDNSLATDVGKQLGFYRLGVPYRETRR